MFEQPLHHRMRHRDVPVDTLFEKHLDSPQDSPDNPNADFNAAVGLRVVSRRRLCTDLLNVLTIDLDHLQCRLCKSLDCGRIVSFQDEARMAEPLDVAHHHVDS